MENKNNDKKVINCKFHEFFGNSPIFSLFGMILILYFCKTINETT